MNSSAGSTPRRYRFADLVLDVGQRRVWRGDRPVALSDLSFELLRVLVEASPDVVTHDDLAAKAWGPRRIVTPENVAKRVMLLRQGLGDQADESRYIEGVRGRGYRLIPEVQPSATEVPRTDANKPSRVGDAGSRRSPLWAYVAAGVFAAAAALLAIDDLRLRGAAQVANAGAVEPFSFVISAPDGSRFGAAPADPSPVLSPNGRYLAFVAPFESQQMLWIQTLGELDARVVPGTEHASRPFWSPDGNFIAFVAQNRLKRIATEGSGAPQDLAMVSDHSFQGGAWAPDATIVFGGADGLYRLRPDGEAVSLTTLDAGHDEFSHRYPMFLPDSDRFVYLVLSAQLDHQGIFLGSLAEPDLKMRLVASAANAAIGIGADGRVNLLFLNDAGALVAQPFDAAGERLSGDAVVIARPVEPGPSVRAAAFSASGRVLAYRPRFAPSSRLVWVDRRGVRGELATPAGQSYRFPALSDDGTKLVAMRDDEPEAAGLWWLALRAGASPERLTRGGELMSAWAPGGQEVVYSAPLPQGWHLLRQPIAGRGDAHSLLAGTEPVVKRIRDVTEEFVLFQGSDADLWLLPLAGEKDAYRVMATPGLENHGRVSPNGRWLAFSSTDANETRVYVTTFPEPTERWLVSPAGGSDPQWRSDGRELYYIAPGDLLTSVEVETEPAFAAGAQTALFDARFDPQTRAFASAYAPAPDGQRFLVAEVAEDSEPYLIVTRNWTRETTPTVPR